MTAKGASHPGTCVLCTRIYSLDDTNNGYNDLRNGGRILGLGLRVRKVVRRRRFVEGGGAAREELESVSSDGAGLGGCAVSTRRP